MQTKKIKNQKPISLDVHLRYRCPNNNCGYEHWLSLLETQTKNFKIVCECGTVFRPKRIEKIKVVYDHKKQKEVKKEKPIEKTIPQINNSLINQAVPSLIDLGFTKLEAIDLLQKAYIKQPIDDLSLLIKNTLLEIRNNGESS